MMVFLISLLTVWNGWAGGVGGLAGGNFRGGDILFQEESRYINPLNRTLCHDWKNYQVTVDKCQRWGGRGGDNCIGPYRDEVIYQPIESMKRGCLEEGPRYCNKRGWIEFVQEPVRILKELDDRGEDTGIEWEYEVPRCR